MPEEENPFKGQVTIEQTYIHTSAKPASRAIPAPAVQSYRNLRSHLSKQANFPAAAPIHAAELTLDRTSDTFFNRLLSWGYELVSDFGNSPVRALLWLCLVLFGMTGILFCSNGGVIIGPLEGHAESWRVILVGDGRVAQLARAIVLALQSSFNPLSIFGVRGVVEARYPWLAALLAFQGIVSITVAALFLLAVRRRFRLL